MFRWRTCRNEPSEIPAEHELSEKKISGVHAAVLTPREEDDSVDTTALARLIRFLSSKGISGFALNGATGEFPLTRPEHLRAMLATAREAANAQTTILCGVGAPGIALTRELVAVAERGGAAGLLLPTPYFFRYQQEDLAAFCREVAKGTSLPILLYNLPQFSTGFEKETVHRLIAKVPNIIGIKDSGGSLDILRHLTETGADACRIVGNDTVLRPALSEGVCDGVISGIACVLPELILALYTQGKRAACMEFDDSWRLLREIANQLDSVPTPWALKWIAEARGILAAHFSQPPAEARRERGAQIKRWFGEWYTAAFSGRVFSA
jgi:4-hydroxy-tetrahydrodipicolinate synthase